jgi:hypothetical protein
VVKCSVCPTGIVLWSSWTFSFLNIMTCSPHARSRKAFEKKKAFAGETTKIIQLGCLMYCMVIALILDSISLG